MKAIGACAGGMLLVLDASSLVMVVCTVFGVVILLAVFWADFTKLVLAIYDDYHVEKTAERLRQNLHAEANAYYVLLGLAKKKGEPVVACSPRRSRRERALCFVRFYARAAQNFCRFRR
jgi:hypothetical protein